MDGNKRQRTLFWVLAILIILLFYLGHFVIHAQKNPLRLDEVDYYQCMENVVRLGFPVYYAGEVSIDHNRLIYLSTRHLDGREFVFWRFKPETGILKETFFALVNDTSRYTFGMWHPPLYIYLGSLIFRLLPVTPENSHSLRYFNLIFSLGIFTGMFALSRESYPLRYRQVFLIASLICAFHSLAIRGSTLIDYNATLGPCAAVWFAVAVLRAERKTHLSWEVTGATVWVLFTGLGLATSLLLGVGLYCLLRLVIGSRRSLAWTLLSVLLGISIFLASFFVFCQVLQLPFSQPFLHQIARLRASPGGLRAPQKLFTTLWTHLWWYSKEIGLSNMVVVTGLSIFSVKRIKLSPRHLLIPIVIATGLFSQASVGANAYWFPKYILFTLPLLFIFVAGESVALLGPSSVWWKKAVCIVILLVITLTNMLNSFHWILQSGSTLYSPGERGLLQIAQALQASTAPDEIVLSRKDIGFFAHRRFIEWKGELLYNVGLLERKVNDTNIHYIVSPTSFVNASTDIGIFLHQKFSVETTEGDFALWHRKD